MYSLYLLTSTIDEKFYVGVTKNPKQRLLQHKSNSRRSKYYNANWINKVLRKGGEISMDVIIKGLTKEKAEELEVSVISKFKEMNLNMTNTAQGGLGFDHTGIPHSEEHKKNLALAQPHKKKIDADELYDYYINQKLSKKSIAKIYNCGITTIDRHLKANNIPIRVTKNYKASEKIDVDKIIDLYVNQNMSALKIGKKLKIHGNLVIRCLRKQGIEIAKASTYRKKTIRVSQYSKGGEFIRRFDSIEELSMHLGKKENAVYKYLKKRNNCWGYIWELEYE